MWGFGKKRGLRGCVLATLQRGPRNGAEIINDVDAMTHGWWRPSPGSIYPLLEELTTEGSIRKLDNGRYELLAPPMFDWGFRGSTPRSAQDAVEEIDGLISYLEDLKRGTKGFPAPTREAIDRVIGRLGRLKE